MTIGETFAAEITCYTLEIEPYCGQGIYGRDYLHGIANKFADGMAVHDKFLRQLFGFIYHLGQEDLLKSQEAENGS